MILDGLKASIVWTSPARSMLYIYLFVMKFLLLLLVALLFTACTYPSHLIRVNESLPKNAPIEKESVVAYVQRDCSSGDCPLENKNVHWHALNYDGNTRQIEFYRYGPRSCKPGSSWGDNSRDRYFVVWHKDGVPYRTIKMFCDESSQVFKAILLSDNESKELPILRTSNDEFADWVVEVK